MMLPTLSEPDVLQALRKNPKTARIPVMVLTSLPQSNEGRMATSATAYFEKSLRTLDQGTGHFVEAVEKRLSKVAKAAGA